LPSFNSTKHSSIRAFWSLFFVCSFFWWLMSSWPLPQGLYRDKIF
jgi:hypothetical protein